MADGLVISELSVHYGRARALDRVSLSFRPGELTAVLGPNGAGKSSLLLAAAGAVPATGQVLLDGRDLSRLPVRARARAGIALVPQGRQLFPRLTVRENLQVQAGILGLGRSAVGRALDMFPILREREASPAGVLSGGEQQMLAVARALMSEPRVVLMDEMVTGLAPMVVRELVRTGCDLARAGATVVVAEPSIGPVKRELDRGYVLLRGAMVGEGTGGDELARVYQERMGVAG